MSCNSAKNVVVEEMEAFLKFIQDENSNYEQERNALKAEFHSRPQEERNIVKDILSMHSEFDMGVTKIKDIVEEISQIPTNKSAETIKAEDLASQIVVMQASLVRKHDILQKFLVQKINYQRLLDEAAGKEANLGSENEELRFKLSEIENFDQSNIFTKKIKMMNSEITRLKGLLSYSGEFQEGSEIWDNEVSGLTEKEASVKLLNVANEIKRIEEELGRTKSRFTSKDDIQRLRGDVEDKALGNEKLKKRLAKINENLGEKNTQGGTKKLKSSTLLQDIEASLSRVRAIASPHLK